MNLAIWLISHKSEQMLAVNERVSSHLIWQASAKEQTLQYRLKIKCTPAITEQESSILWIVSYISTYSFNRWCFSCKKSSIFNIWTAQASHRWRRNLRIFLFIKIILSLMLPQSTQRPQNLLCSLIIWNIKVKYKHYPRQQRVSTPYRE